MPKLTKSLIAAIEPPESGTETLWDSEVRGFGVRVTKNGVKSFVLKYTNAAGTARWMTLCRVGELTVDEARERCRVIRGRVAAGEDPAAERMADRKAETVEELLGLYEKEGLIIQRGKDQGKPMKPLTAQYTMARLRHHVSPLLGKKRCKDIGAGDIERFVRDVAAGKTAKDEKVAPRKRIIVKGGEGAARKVVRDFSAVCSFAVRRAVMPSNPCEKAAVRKVDNRKELFLSLDQIAALGAILKAMEEEGVSRKATDSFRLLALTGCRRNEILGLKWSEVDFHRGLLALDDSKTGKSIRPLGAATMTVLAGIKQTDSPYVFPASDGSDGFYQGGKRFWPIVRDRAKLPKGTTFHTLRHSIGSLTASSGESLLITGAVLGHSNPRSTAIYAHISQDPAKRAADHIAGQIHAAMSGKQKAEVVPLRSAK
ncbi:tyrosine-type recombinase/integrase [Rhizobium leguminosarum]